MKNDTVWLIICGHRMNTVYV